MAYQHNPKVLAEFRANTNLDKKYILNRKIAQTLKRLHKARLNSSFLTNNIFVDPLEEHHHHKGTKNRSCNQQLVESIFSAPLEQIKPIKTVKAPFFSEEKKRISTALSRPMHKMISIQEQKPNLRSELQTAINL